LKGEAPEVGLFATFSTLFSLNSVFFGEKRKKTIVFFYFSKVEEEDRKILRCIQIDVIVSNGYCIQQ